MSRNMESSFEALNLSVLWRGNNYKIEISSNACVKDLGDELQRLTHVRTDTLRLIVPQKSGKGSKLLYPFSEDQACLSLQEASIIEGITIRMMGVSEDEVDKFMQDAKANLRIAGFDEEEKRRRQRNSRRPSGPIRLPQGPYTFCDFRTLQLPGIELNPPASEALKRMHKLAVDPGIVAIMNKHRWRVGIMTEMAPVGYVGISPKCILGFNKNQGEEISLRLRTDDLKGFRKYDSIKKTLLHELAHMVYSEHDEHFHALDRQLNQEAFSLDWTKSTGHTLSGVGRSELDEEEDFDFEDHESMVHKLGGEASDQLMNARASSVAAAYRRLSSAPVKSESVCKEPDPDDSELSMCGKPDHRSINITKDSPDIMNSTEFQQKIDLEQDPNSGSVSGNTTEPEHDDSQDDHVLETDNLFEPAAVKLGPNDPQVMKNTKDQEPDPDESVQHQQAMLNVQMDEPDPDDSSHDQKAESKMQIDEPDPDDEELSRIQDPVTVFIGRLHKSIEMLQAELGLKEAALALQTLFKIIGNLIEHPNEIKFKRLRKANPMIQRSIVKNKGAMEILYSIGFIEDIILDETFLVLKRNDPGLFWLAKSLIESRIA